MHMRKLTGAVVGGVVMLGALALGVRVALAHCDGMDGPVVAAARQALRSGNVNLVLIWVRQEDEPEITAAFQQAMTVRALGPDAQALADRSFFETLVRVHRAGEGAPYTGLKPAGRDLGPAIPAADRAVQTGNLSTVRDLLVQSLEHGLQEQFETMQDLRGYDPNDVEAGRRYVHAYVEYIHYVERLYESATTTVAGHYAEAPH